MPRSLRDLKAAPGAALVAGLLFLFWALTLPTTSAWGWDETMHAELPAARILTATLDGNLESASRTLHSCQQYPPGWPLVLAFVQGLFGVSEQVARLATLAAWCLTLFGLFLLGQELARAQRSESLQARRGDDLIPWLMMAFGALSPLALHYAGTLFLEVPFTLCLVFGLRAWLRRGRRNGERNLAWREFVAGLWLTAAFFTKFNYGALLAFGLGLDAACELITEYRAGRLSEYLRRCAMLCVVPVAGILWWFVLPLPEGFATAEQHRAAFLSFLSGNREMAPTPWSQRSLYWVAYFALTARLFLVQACGLLASSRELARPGARMVWLVWLGAGIPVWTHNFHLDRFLVPGGPAFWALAALGLARLLPSAGRKRGVAVATLAALTLVSPSLDAERVASALGLLSAKPEVREIQTEALGSWSRMGADRPMPTAGASRSIYDGLMQLVIAEVGSEERLGWFGVSSELAPGAIHLSLLAAGGSHERFLRDSIRPMDVTFEAADPGWSDEQLRDFVRGFDVVFSTDPPDLAKRGGRAFVRDYSQRLAEDLGWSAELIGEVHDARDSSAVPIVRLYALRPPL